jgi:hypothetical protein
MIALSVSFKDIAGQDRKTLAKRRAARPIAPFFYLNPSFLHKNGYSSEKPFGQLQEVSLEPG